MVTNSILGKPSLDIGASMLRLQLIRGQLPEKRRKPAPPRPRGLPGPTFIATWFRGKREIVEM